MIPFQPLLEPLAIMGRPILASAVIALVIYLVRRF